MKKIYVLPAFLFICIFSFSQTIIYSYDNSGNRDGRVYVPPSKSTMDDNKSSSEEQTEKPLCDQFGDIGIKIYPNPTRGELSIELENLPEDIEGQISVYDISGKLVYIQTELVNINPVNIESYADGMYTLRIILGDNISEWKLIKE